MPLAPGSNSIVVVATDPSGNTAGLTRTVLLSTSSSPPGSPDVTATASATSGPAPFDVLFDGLAVGTGTIGLWEWDFEGDGTFDFSSPTSPVTSHTYTEPGCFGATLRATDDSGLTGVDSIGIGVE